MELVVTTQQADLGPALIIQEPGFTAGPNDADGWSLKLTVYVPQGLNQSRS